MSTQFNQNPAVLNPDRRDFIGLTTAGAGLLALGQLACSSPVRAASIHDSHHSTPVSTTLNPLPWANDALEPIISANTLSFHYGKHHQAYLTNLNTLLAANPALGFTGLSLEAIIRATAGKKDPVLLSIYRNAAQVYNHDFYWNSLTPTGGGEPVGEIADRINADFGDYATFRTRLIDTAVGQFGTGWAWVVASARKKISIISSNDADTPLTLKPAMTPLLTIDVWEHAYYLDYQNGRKTYVTAVVDKLLDWDFANQNLAA